EDGIRDFHVTGVQTCALPISYEVRRFQWVTGASCTKSHKRSEKRKNEGPAGFGGALAASCACGPVRRSPHGAGRNAAPETAGCTGPEAGARRGIPRRH